jgi:protein TonB
MKTKKTAKANLEKKKTLFFQLGLIISLSLVFLAFEWKQSDKNQNEWDQIAAIDIPEELIQITTPEKEPPRPKPQTTDIEEVEDDEKAEDIKINVEDDLLTKVKEFIIIEKVKETPKEEEIFEVVQKMPEFNGGEKEMYEYLAKKMKYPEAAKAVGVQGIVYIGFVVEKDGSISNTQILRDIGAGCGEEALRVVNDMPKWIPGEQRDKKVRVKFTLPVKFTLQP